MKPITRNDAIAYICLSLGMTIGSAVFVSVVGLSLYFMGAGPVAITAILALTAPSMLAPAAFFAFMRNEVILFNDSRGLLWVMGSIVTITAKWTFCCPFLIVGFPLYVLCSIARNKVCEMADVKRWFAISRFHMPAHQ